MTREELVGRRFVFGLPGPDVTDADIRLFRDTGAGGLMLYRRNFETPERLLRLLERLEDALGRRLLVATDHEGGRVIMLGGGVTIFPDNLAAASAGEVAFVNRQGAFEGRELRRLGVDVNFAPVLDVLTEAYSPNIGIRSYGKDPALVARCGVARIRGLQSAGISACAKHFPGKGHAPVDAHLGLPVIDSDWSEMHASHLLPFLAAIEAGVDCVMTSHPLYPKLDPAPRTPVTFSRLIVEDYLRGQLGYRGLIVSDDLEMGAIAELAPVGEAAVLATVAGHDLLLVCNTESAQRAAHAAVLDASRHGTLPLRALEQTAQRLDALQGKRPTRVAGGPPRPERDGEPLAKALATRAVTFVAPAPAGWHSSLNGRVVAVFPRLSALADRITVEPS
ncbi:MAG TPA: glycoside hydrolase family 3 N-terminal domain-containing protein, partial [Methylomirabilota bacterium]|nr:glycoside hydrolase family 3 N-terminal domain-containing protein [Methylomirabilota bacterium]